MLQGVAGGQPDVTSVEEAHRARCLSLAEEFFGVRVGAGDAQGREEQV